MKRKPSHFIKDLSFAERWLECSCSLMTIPDPETFADHRRAAGAPTAWASDAIRTDRSANFMPHGTGWVKPPMPKPLPKMRKVAAVLAEHADRVCTHGHVGRWFRNPHGHVGRWFRNPHGRLECRDCRLDQNRTYRERQRAA